MKTIKLLITFTTAILVPVGLVFIGIRVLLSPGFLAIEYRMPGFPDDSFGFSFDERLEYSNLALEYLVNDSDISFLKDLKFPEGESLYNDRELSHMIDVKNVIKPAIKFGYISWVLIGCLGLLAIWVKDVNRFLLGLRFGAWLLLGLIILSGIFAVISFWNFFSVFHSLFFEGESWIFFYSDTLIRLFPLRFWQDAFIFEGLITIGSCWLILKLIKVNRDN